MTIIPASADRIRVIISGVGKPAMLVVTGYESYTLRWIAWEIQSGSAEIEIWQVNDLSEVNSAEKAYPSIEGATMVTSASRGTYHPALGPPYEGWDIVDETDKANYFVVRVASKKPGNTIAHLALQFLTG